MGMTQEQAGYAAERVREGGFSFLIAASVRSGEFRNALPRLDSLIDTGNKCKDSRSTTASICDLPGYGTVFVKRTNNKGLRFTLRYLFRPARAFRAARAADRLHRAGIETPAVLAVGEHRRCRVLLGGYLINERKQNVTEAYHVLLNAENPGRCVAEIMEKAGRLLASIHLQHVIHRDFKLANIYFSGDGSCGVWDLDGARIYPSSVPQSLMMVDLARLVASALSVLKLRKERFEPDLRGMCGQLAEAYSSCSPSLSVAGVAIEAALQKFFPQP